MAVFAAVVEVLLVEAVDRLRRRFVIAVVKVERMADVSAGAFKDVFVIVLVFCEWAEERVVVCLERRDCGARDELDFKEVCAVSVPRIVDWKQREKEIKLSMWLKRCGKIMDARIASKG